LGLLQEDLPTSPSPFIDDSWVSEAFSGTETYPEDDIVDADEEDEEEEDNGVTNDNVRDIIEEGEDGMLKVTRRCGKKSKKGKRGKKWGRK
jgi:hypothetical protein